MNSHPEDIKTVLKMSKKTFKKKSDWFIWEKLIEIKDDGIYLVKNRNRRKVNHWG
jgi:predicted RNA-binding protein (virulence factor B family)